MYYKSGNFEAFARPRKPKGVDEKSAYIVGSGIGSLAAAAFLIRDGHMDGRRITILEAAKPEANNEPAFNRKRMLERKIVPIEARSCTQAPLTRR
jgi:hypothetical protein